MDKEEKKAKIRKYRLTENIKKFAEVLEDELCQTK